MVYLSITSIIHNSIYLRNDRPIYVLYGTSKYVLQIKQPENHNKLALVS